MKRILKLLARLYPLSWRERYGSEYEALLEDTPPRARDAFDVLWNAMQVHLTSRGFVRIVLPCTLAGGVVAFAISFARPPIYVSKTLISVETSDRSWVTNQLASQVRDSAAEASLISIIQSENLYPRELARMPISDVVSLMRKNIWIGTVQLHNGKPTPVFGLEFSYPDPHVAQRVDERLAAGLLAENLRVRVASATADILKRQLSLASDPVIKARIESQLRQIDTVASRFRIPPTEEGTFQVDYPANLPQSPVFPKRSLFGATGLFTGSLGGLTVATIAGRRRTEGANI